MFVYHDLDTWDKINFHLRIIHTHTHINYIYTYIMISPENKIKI